MSMPMEFKIILLISVVCLFRESAAGCLNSKCDERIQYPYIAHIRPIVIPQNVCQLYPDFLRTVRDAFYNTTDTVHSIGSAVLTPLGIRLQTTPGGGFLISNVPYGVPIAGPSHQPIAVGEQVESPTAAEQHPDLSSGDPFEPLFPGNLSSLENFVHQNIKDMEDWMSQLNDTQMANLCAKTFTVKLALLFNETLLPPQSRGVTCGSDVKKAVEVVYKYLENVPSATAEILHCVCQAPTTGTDDIVLPFYLIEMGSSESDEHMNFHYVYLYSDPNAESNEEKCNVQFGWKVTVEK